MHLNFTVNFSSRLQQIKYRYKSARSKVNSLLIKLGRYFSRFQLSADINELLKSLKVRKSFSNVTTAGTLVISKKFHYLRNLTLM